MVYIQRRNFGLKGGVPIQEEEKVEMGREDITSTSR